MKHLNFKLPKIMYIALITYIISLLIGFILANVIDWRIPLFAFALSILILAILDLAGVLDKYKHNYNDLTLKTDSFTFTYEILDIVLYDLMLLKDFISYDNRTINRTLFVYKDSFYNITYLREFLYANAPSHNKFSKYYNSVAYNQDIFDWEEYTTSEQLEYIKELIHLLQKELV